MGLSLLNFPPFRLDPSNERLWRETVEIPLRPKTFAVLRYLVEHSQQLVTKEELLAAVWAETVVGEDALTGCIRDLRKALGDEAKRPQYIETVHRRGFRFIAAVTTPSPVQSSRFNVYGEEEGGGEQKEEKQKPVLSPSAALRINSVEGANGENGLASSVQSLESENPVVALPSDQTLDPKLQTPDTSVSASSSRFLQIVVLAAVLFLTMTVLTVQYLSRPSLSTQDSAIKIDAAPTALPLPDKPSIAVLPFTNMSKDPAQEYFSDGLTDDLITDLSRISSLFVIARNSTFTYKGKPTKVQEISRELGVRYVLEGSVQKAEGQIRINVQLVDALTGDHLWVERYDRPFSELFTLQDEIVQKIVTTLKLQLALEEEGAHIRKHTDNLEAYDAYLRAAEYFVRYTKETNAQARQLWEKALALDPQYADACTMLGWTYWMEWSWHWSADPQTLERAAALAQQALALDDSLPIAHSLLSHVYAYRQQYDQAIAEGEQAIALNPNHADSYAWQAEVLIFAGRPEEARQAVKHAMRLNPHYLPWYLAELGSACRATGRYAESIAALKDAISRNPNFMMAYLHLAVSYCLQWLSQQSPADQTLEPALAAVQRALVLNDAYSGGHLILGYVYLWQKQYEQAVAEVKRAVALAPNDALNYATLAWVLGCVGRTEDALEAAAQALRLKPEIADSHLSSVGSAYAVAGHYEEARTALRRYLNHYPNILRDHLMLAVVYSELGQTDEARAEAAEVLRINPNFSLEVHKQREPIKDPAVLEQHIAALRKAGLK